MDVRIIGRDIGLLGYFVAHVKMKAPGVTAQKRAGEKAPGNPSSAAWQSRVTPINVLSLHYAVNAF